MAPPSITFKPETDASVGSNVRLEASIPSPAKYTFLWDVPAGSLHPDATSRVVSWNTSGVTPGAVEVTVTATPKGTGEAVKQTETYELTKAPYGDGDIVPIRTPENNEQEPFNVALRRSSIVDTSDQPLWDIIKRSTERLSYERYERFMDFIFCGKEAPEGLSPQLRSKWSKQRRRAAEASAVTGDPDPYPGTRLPFVDVESYRLLKAATEAFLMVNCGVEFDPAQFDDLDIDDLEREESLGLARGDTLGGLMQRYLHVDGEDANGNGAAAPNADFPETIPYLRLVRRNVQNVPLTISKKDEIEGRICDAILREKLTNPCFIELLWSYWQEEGMLVQTMNAITMRFQNRRGPGAVDPLANLTIDPLRPLSNLIWGYIQDEQHRLTLARRVYEYDHEYGLTLYGRAVPRVRGADSRSRFLEAFHTLLHRASIFYKEDDDTTMIADPFPVLNALRDVHLLLAEGAHNQWGDLPWTARHEMLMQQWLLARPELREFLPRRVMVAYPESWMPSVDAMKRVQGWSDISVRYFRDLAVYGEQILLGIRFGDWSNTIVTQQAGNWARFWREQVQWYIHAYNTVSGVDLSSDMQDSRRAELRPDRYMQPAFHLQRRLVQQQRRVALQQTGRNGRRSLGRSGGFILEGEAQEAGGGREHAESQIPD
jgi:hypothetical protein